MNSVLNSLLSTGFLERLDGDDGRVSKLEKASSTVAAELKADPTLLIGAVLAGMDPEVPGDDPAIARAERALVAEWRSLRSVFPDKPINWYRAILLEACAMVGDGRLSAVLWLTAADHLPYLRLGREEPPIRALVLRWAEACENEAMVSGPIPTAKKPATSKLNPGSPGAVPAARKVDRNSLLQRVGAAAGPQLRGQALPNPNPGWTNNVPHWSHEFSDRMATLLGDELDAVGADVAKRVSDGVQSLYAIQSAHAAEVQSALAAQGTWLEGALRSALAQRSIESTQLEALWWSEALYSPSLKRSYREISPEVAATVMARDLLDLMSSPSPASVGYLLAEAVGRLPNAAHERRVRFSEIIRMLRAARKEIPADLLTHMKLPAENGRLSIRDVLVLAMSAQEVSMEAALTRSALREDPEVALPELAHAFFRQEQAVTIAGARK